MTSSHEQPFGWALIGCGSVGRSHSRGAVETPDIDVHAFCDINEEAASSYYEQFEGRYYTTDVDRIFADDSIEIVTQSPPRTAPTPSWPGRVAAANTSTSKSRWP